MTHVVLLGDSVFDNKSYTGNLPDVPAYLDAVLPEWDVTMLARDGATTASIGWQLHKVPRDATHLVVSIGGNDALGNSDMLRLTWQPPRRGRNRRRGLQYFQVAMAVLHDRIRGFASDYAEALDEVRALGLPVTVCTIYNPDYAGLRAQVVRTALSVFNDEILRYARRHDLGVIELRDVCTIPEDFELDIEPSGTGGLKVALAIGEHVTRVAVPA